MIERVLFDEQDGTLSVWFHGSGHYAYDGVPRAIFDGLTRTPSVGAYFNDCIRGRFSARRTRRRYPLDRAG